uniref:Uncharacterized protein n=1 Tax=Anguilla anguilla TaxID=7936 RepID=A0A0E9T395_ANGAN
MPVHKLMSPEDLTKEVPKPSCYTATAYNNELFYKHIPSEDQPQWKSELEHPQRI